MDRERLVRFVQEDYSRVVAAVGVTCGDRALAEDAVQEVLAAALDHDRPVENLSGWVVVSAVNRVRSGSRRRSAEQRAVERLRRVPPPGSAAPTAVAGEVLEALRALPERQREITALHYLLDLSVADIATSLEVSEGTVKTQLHRARTALRARLEPAATGDANDEEVDHVT